MFDDISFLVQETFREVEKNNKAKNLFQGFWNQKQNLPDEVTGVLFHIQKNAATFVVRVHVSENLKLDYLSVMKHPDLFPALRFEEDDNLQEKLMFFECDDLKVAKAIKEKLGNKRFPIFEEQVFNISDPGDSWWLKRERNRLSIFFKLTHTNRLDNLIKLGPLGDGEKAMEIFSKLYGYFQMIFDIQDYSSAFGQFSIASSQEGDKFFEYFYELLATGDVSHEFWDKLRNLEILHSHEAYANDLKQANYFIMELSQLRRFWCEIQENL